jgi:hypothetical protein
MHQIAALFQPPGEISDREISVFLHMGKRKLTAEQLCASYPMKAQTANGERSNLLLATLLPGVFLQYINDVSNEEFSNLRN